MIQILSKRTDNWIFILVSVFAHLNIFLVNKFGISYVHYVIMMIYCIIYFTQYPAIKRRVSPKQIMYLKLYFISIIFLIIFNLLFYQYPISFIFNSLANYLLVPLFILLILCRNDINWLHLFYFIIGLALLSSLLGVYQYFFDRSLFGTYDFSDFYINELLFRTRGNLSSPQVYGLFLAISAIISFEILKLSNRKIFLACGVFILSSGLLSGNKSVIFLLMIYLAYTLRHLSKNSINIRKNVIRGLMISMLTSIILIVVNPSFLKIDSSLSQIANRMNIFSQKDGSEILQSEQDGRLRIYNSHFDRIAENPLVIIFGDGIGSYSSVSRASNEDRIASESYFLQIFLEYGILPLLFLILILYNSLKYHLKNKNWVNYYIMLAIIWSGFFVHAFVYPVFFLFWIPILMLKLNSNTKNENYSNSLLL